MTPFWERKQNSGGYVQYVFNWIQDGWDENIIGPSLMTDDFMYGSAILAVYRQTIWGSKKETYSSTELKLLIVNTSLVAASSAKFIRWTKSSSSMAGQ